MRIVRLVVAGCAAALLTGCAATATTQLSAVESSETPLVAGRQSSAAPHAAGMYSAFGEQHTWNSGLVVTISAPRSIKPSGSAYPQAARAAVFELTIDNGTASPYKPSQLTVRALLGNSATQEVVDTAQGLNGFVAAAQDIPPGKSAKLTLAFAMPKQPTSLRVVVQPDVSGAAPSASFQGTA
ncbi:hypothetical protein GCM10010174_54140 [Kutzneria viridogrisea]|uniref:DUF4352 domain-containing protein n=2 Tax=Kutzneria TaxID=43356 RepID=W5W0E9_9PSEU|nr:hypothetical protein [Kutzneria albida]AHH94638.1 hypothetical protein KALB_1265 [Kutzneria albida DSM 43870]MBA8930306.1 hypothetical protein [Kutzneria viridogrisea]